MHSWEGSWAIGRALHLCVAAGCLPHPHPPPPLTFSTRTPTPTPYPHPHLARTCACWQAQRSVDKQYVDLEKKLRMAQKLEERRAKRAEAQQPQRAQQAQGTPAAPAADRAAVSRAGRRLPLLLLSILSFAKRDDGAGRTPEHVQQSRKWRWLRPTLGAKQFRSSEHPCSAPLQAASCTALVYRCSCGLRQRFVHTFSAPIWPSCLQVLDLVRRKLQERLPAGEGKEAKQVRRRGRWQSVAHNAGASNTLPGAALCWEVDASAGAGCICFCALCN